MFAGLFLLEMLFAITSRLSGLQKNSVLYSGFGKVILDSKIGMHFFSSWNQKYLIKIL